MLNQVRKTLTFQNDLKKYGELLQVLPDGHEKEECKQLVNNLIQEVKKMDDFHTEIIYNKQMRSIGTECREKISRIRKQLENKCKEHKIMQG